MTAVLVMSKSSITRRAFQSNQRGIAVVIALLVLAVLSLLGVTMMGLSVTESQIGSNEGDLKKAFFAAEAGIHEAMYRMRLDPASGWENPTSCTATSDPALVGFAPGGTLTIPSPDPTNWNPGNSNSFWYYNPTASGCSSWSYTPGADSDPRPPGNFFGGKPGNLDSASAGRTFTSSGSAHTTGGALINANLTNGGSYTVNVSPVVGYVGTCWQYVNQVGTPLPGSSCAPATVATNPVFKVTSTGAARTARKVLSTMIRRFNVNPNPDAPLTANSDVEVTSASAIIDGRDHKCNGDISDDPTDPDNKPAVAAPPKPPPNETVPDIETNKPENLVCEAGVGVAACGTIREAFPSTIGELLLGHPYLNESPTPARQAEIYTFNAYLESIKVLTGPPEIGPPFHGIVYVNGNYTQPPDGSTGILIVHNATSTANLGNWNGGTFKGVVIADGINKINGNVTIIGAVYGWGTASTIEVDITAGTPQFKYSKCVMDGLNQNFPFQIVRGTWHEQ